MKIKALIILLAAALLSACSAMSNGTPTPLPTVVLGSGSADISGDVAAPIVASSGGVTASGVIIAAREAQLAATAPVDVAAVNVSVGDSVRAGQVLVEFGGRDALNAAVDAANLALLSARQDLKALQDNAEKSRSAAQLRLANAQKALEEAEKQRTWKQYRNGSQSAIESAQADFILAKNAFETAQDNFSPFEDSAADDINRAAALSALSAARSAYDRALANLNYLLAMPQAVDVNQVEAKFKSAQAEVGAAQTEYDRLKDGVDPDALALAEARVKNAQASLQASQTALDHLQMKAPFDGVVAKISVNAGEWVVPGQPVLALVDLSRLRARVTDLSERDVPRVASGQPVNVFVKALGQNISGRVSEISPLADTLGGDVVYITFIDLDTQPAELRPGMSVDVSFQTGPQKNIRPHCYDDEFTRRG